MLRILIAFLKACTQILTFIILAIERWPQRNKNDSYAQTDITLHPKSKEVIFHRAPPPQLPKATAPPPPLPKATAPTVEPKPTGNVGKPRGSDYPRCPKCDNRMLVKKANHGGMFFGCSQWPACNGSRSWRDYANTTSDRENT